MITITTNHNEIKKAYNKQETSENGILEDQIRSIIYDYTGRDDEKAVAKIINKMWSTQYSSLGELIQTTLQ